MIATSTVGADWAASFSDFQRVHGSARLYPLRQYGLDGSVQCASRCPSAGPWWFHALQCRHQTRQRTTPFTLILSAGSVGASRSMQATALIGTFTAAAW